MKNLWKERKGKGGVRREAATSLHFSAGAEISTIVGSHRGEMGVCVDLPFLGGN
jgi:hypothetical protein